MNCHGNQGMMLCIIRYIEIFDVWRGHNAGLRRLFPPLATPHELAAWNRVFPSVSRFAFVQGEWMMLHRVLPLLAILALVCLVSAPALAADETVAEGTVVKAGDGKLTIADKDKKEHSCTVGKDAKISCDGKDCKLDDLKKGVKVKVTLEGKGDKTTATKIVASTK